MSPSLHFIEQMDDAALLAAIANIQRMGGDAMELQAELERRKRFENQWSGEWGSGPAFHIPRYIPRRR